MVKEAHTIEIILRLHCEEKYAKRLEKKIRNYIKAVVSYHKLIEVDGGIH